MAAFLHDRRVRIGAGVVAGLILLAFVVLAAFPWGSLKPMLERRLSARFGQPVTIGSVDRLDGFGFTPKVAVRDVRIPQVAWAGPGDLARVREGRLTFSALPLLFGRFAPRDIRITGLRLNLVRDAQRRESWRPQGGAKGKGSPLDLTGLAISDSVISYRDAVQQRQATLRVSADAQHGVRADGPGTIKGAPVRIAFRGPAVTGKAAPWPFSATIDGAALSLTAIGTMDRALDTGAMRLHVTTRAADLKLLDAVIEAGLFGTQPVGLSADVRHDDPKWTITNLTGTIGNSQIAGHLNVDKVDNRTKLDGAVVSDRLTFEDLATDASNAAALAEQRAIGLRLVPKTRINLAKIDNTDGRIAFRVGRIVGKGRPTALRTLRGTLELDHQRLTVAPLTIGLTQGAITGRVVVDQRGGRPVPNVTFDLKLADSSIGALAGGGGKVTGRVDARAYLVGRGSTIREAVGASSGRIGLVARDGALPEKIAAALGFDAGRAIFGGGKDERSGLHCAVVGVQMRDGRGAVSPFVIDTSESQLSGQGSLVFPAEALAIRMTGAPKRGSVIRLPGSATLTGSIREPHVELAQGTKSIGNIFKALGRAITGHQGPTATDADCSGLAARVLK